MANQTRRHGNPQEPDSGARRPARQQSNPDNVVRKGGVAKSDAEIGDVSRDTHGFPGGQGGTGATSAPSDMRVGAAAEADAALTEALEEAKADGDGERSRHDPQDARLDDSAGPRERAGSDRRFAGPDSGQRGAVNSAQRGKEPAQETGSRGHGPEETEAAGE